MGTKYSSVSNDASHSVKGPNRLSRWKRRKEVSKFIEGSELDNTKAYLRHEFSAAYWLERSPVESWAGILLLQTVLGQSTRVTFPGYDNNVSSNDVSLVWAPLLSYTYIWSNPTIRWNSIHSFNRSIVSVDAPRSFPRVLNSADAQRQPARKWGFTSISLMFGTNFLVTVLVTNVSISVSVCVIFSSTNSGGMQIGILAHRPLASTRGTTWSNPQWRTGSKIGIPTFSMGPIISFGKCISSYRTLVRMGTTSTCTVGVPSLRTVLPFAIASLNALFSGTGQEKCKLLAQNNTPSLPRGVNNVSWFFL